MGTQLPYGKQPPPHFKAYVYCGQTAAWIKIPPGMEVGLIPSEITLDGDPAPPYRKERTIPPLFGPLLWMASPQALILPITRIVD